MNFSFYTMSRGRAVLSFWHLLINVGWNMSIGIYRFRIWRLYPGNKRKPYSEWRVAINAPATHSSQFKQWRSWWILMKLWPIIDYIMIIPNPKVIFYKSTFFYHFWLERWSIILSKIFNQNFNDKFRFCAVDYRLYWILIFYNYISLDKIKTIENSASGSERTPAIMFTAKFQLNRLKDIPRWGELTMRWVDGNREVGRFKKGVYAFNDGCQKEWFSGGVKMLRLSIEQI